MGAALVVIAVLSGLALLLAVPVEVAFRFDGIEAFQGQIAIRWLLGLVRFRVRVPGSRERRPEPGTGTKAAELRAKPEKRPGRSHFLAVVRQAPFRRRLYRLLSDLVRAVHLRHLRLRLRLGLGDPADTGRLWAVVGPLAALARDLPHAEVRIAPEFVDPVLQFEAHGRLLLVPLQFVALATSFALSPSSIRAWRTLRGGRA